MGKQDSTQRFSNRVANYVRYRPTYPPDLYHFLRRQCKLSQESSIAEVGSGTGILSKMFLKQDHSLIGIEPNLEMRLAGEELLAQYDRFESLNGRAELLPLSSQSIDLLLAAQAFHWFDAKAFRLEALRVLKTQGKVALIWNSWGPELSPFLAEYDALLKKYGTDFQQVSERWMVTDESINEFFGGDHISIRNFPNAQLFDFEGLAGRLLSSSYAPQKGDPGYAEMMTQLKSLFRAFKGDEKVEFKYDTVCYLGSIRELPL